MKRLLVGLFLCAASAGAEPLLEMPYQASSFRHELLLMSMPGVRVIPSGPFGTGGGTIVCSAPCTNNRIAKWSGSGSNTLTDSSIIDSSGLSGAFQIAGTTWFIAYSNAAPSSSTIRGVSVTAGTTDTAGGAMNIEGGASTGTAEGGDIFFRSTPAGGASASTVNSQVQIARIGLHSFAFGTFVSRTVATSTIQGVGAIGTDASGGGLLVRSGPGTGTGAAGSFELDQYLPNSASGTTAHSAAIPIIRTDGTDGAVAFGGAGSAGNGIPSHITVPDVTVSGHIRTGADLNGGALILQGGPGNGTGTSGSTIVRYSPAGSTGTAQNTPTNALIVGTNGNTDVLRHLHASGDAPTVSSCGTTPSITGSDIAGKVTTGSGGTLQSCTLTFSFAYATAPACFVNDETQILILRAVSTTTTLVIDCAIAGCLESDVVSYFCIAGS